RRPTGLRQVQRLASALEPSGIADIENGAYCLLPEASLLDAQLIDDAINSVLPGSHRGWALVRAAASAGGIDGRRPAHDAPVASREAIVSTARAVCGTVRPVHQISALLVLSATLPAKDSPSGRLFRRLIEAFVPTDVFIPQVLPHIELPTADGQWRRASEI